MFHIQPFILFQGFLSGLSDFSNQDSAHNISEVNLDSDQNDKKFRKPEREKKLFKKKIIIACLQQY